MVAMWPGMAVTLAKLINSKLCQNASFPPSPTFLFLSKAIPAVFKPKCCLLKYSSVFLPPGHVCLLWLLEPLQTPLCWRPLSHNDFARSLLSLLKCCAPSMHLRVFSVLSPAEHVECLLSDQLCSPGASLGVSVRRETFLWVFWGLPCEIAVSRIK